MKKKSRIDSLALVWEWQFKLVWLVSFRYAKNEDLNRKFIGETLQWPLWLAHMEYLNHGKRLLFLLLSSESFCCRRSVLFWFSAHLVFNKIFRSETMRTRMVSPLPSSSLRGAFDGGRRRSTHRAYALRRRPSKIQWKSILKMENFLLITFESLISSFSIKAITCSLALVLALFLSTFCPYYFAY